MARPRVSGARLQLCRGLGAAARSLRGGWHSASEVVPPRRAPCNDAGDTTQGWRSRANRVPGSELSTFHNHLI